MSSEVAQKSKPGPAPLCRGELPLTARLEPWQSELCKQPDLLAALVERYGSPLNLIDPSAIAGNARELETVASAAGVAMRIFFARKANKALALVDEAKRLGLGVDVASERELSQVLARGIDGSQVVVTAAIKPPTLIELSLRCGATIVLDNFDELELLTSRSSELGLQAPVALRLSPELGDATVPSRFGFSATEFERARELLRAGGLGIDGVHFHLDGYDPGQRAVAIAQCLDLVDRLRELGEQPSFIDIGGGIPVSYLESAAQWDRFWDEHRRGLLGERRALTFGAHGLGLTAHRGELLGSPDVYPFFQQLVGGDWLQAVLSDELVIGSRRESVASAISSRGLELRCEPGRALLDGCGMTVAEVMFVKQRRDGITLVGLAMNRTQCRSTSADFLVDPILVAGSKRARLDPAEGYLVGAYCIERELLTWRRLEFPGGIEAGDLIAFPNTAGYFMHILESASHQIPLARNVIVGSGEPQLDPIDLEDVL